jgi:uncharacterized membrane-anchored protein
MNKAWWLILVFGLMVAAQWWVPVGMITGSNRILEEGTPMKFRCAPVDPNDPFRGKYIVLRFDIEHFLADTTLKLKVGQTVYLTFKEDSVGFAQNEKVSVVPPSSNQIFLKTKVTYIGKFGVLEDLVKDPSKWYIDLDIPFNRFFLEETKAPQAENLYNTGISDTTGNTYGLVYLLNGEARIKDVIIRDTSILERLRRVEK